MPYKGYKLSEKHKQKISETLKGRKLTKEHKKKIGLAQLDKKNHNYGKKLSDECKKKISLALIGRIGGHTGRKHSKETIRKISESLKGRILSEKHKRKIGLSNKGKKFSEERRKNISNSKKGKNLREKSPRWKGGKKISRDYIWVLEPKHPFCNSEGYILESRLIMGKFLNRYLTHEEVIHHINEIVDDNRIENLILFANNGEHKKYHGKLQKVS